MPTLGELAQLVHGAIRGDSNLNITGVSEIQSATPGTITFLINPRYRKYLNETQASAVVVSLDEKVENIPAIQVKNPTLAFSQILNHFAERIPVVKGIHPTALIGDGVTLGDKISIGAYVVIENNVSLGNHVIVGSQSYIGQNVVIGDESELKACVTIYHNCQIGKHVLIHSGSVVGSDGFGYRTKEGTHHKIPQIGKVIIEDDVEIGANSTIDRGTLGETLIGAGSKLDNLVHVAHNVKIGKGCLIAALVGIAGSSHIGDYVYFGGQAGVRDHVTVGNHTQLAAKTGVTKSLSGNRTYAGMPAREIHKKNKLDALVARLPQLVEKIKALESELAELKNIK